MVCSPQQSPAPIQNAPLWRNGGFAVFDQILTPELHTALLQEAWDVLPRGKREDVEDSDSEEWRGGCPLRRFTTVPGDSQLDFFYHSEAVRDLLRHLIGFPMSPSGHRGQYIFYSECGDHISTHRDIESCDVVMITCLFDSRPREPLGGTLYFYPDRHNEPLSLIRQTPEQGCVGIKLTMGQTLILFGGMVPHGIIPMASKQIRVVSTLCFQY